MPTPLKFAAIIIVIFILSEAFAKERSGLAIAPSVFIPTSAKVETPSLFYGGTAYFQERWLRARIGVHFGNKNETPTVFGTKLNSATETLLELTIGFVIPFHQTRRRNFMGPYWGGGVGYAHEHSKIIRENGKNYSQEYKDSTYLFEVVGGAQLERLDIAAAYQLFPKSENVTGALILFLAILL